MAIISGRKGLGSMKSRADDKRTKAHPALETIKTRVEERVNAAGVSKNEASRRAGLGLSYVNDLLSGKSLNPTRESLAKLGQVLDTDADYFFGTQNTPKTSALPPSNLLAVETPPMATGTIPLFRIGLPDPDGFFPLASERKASWTSPLTASRDVYAITVPDDCMAPRYRMGEVAIVSANTPVVHGGFAVVRQTDDRVAIRQIVAITTDKIIVRCLNGETDADLPRAKVKALERIIGSCELI
ncbi:transcriptional regulator with XRE-family HTH domain [Bradyrhizobium sp. IAR9]|uniref:XRE family transcriptional regulator n=1 Tax=Bradyrhizobium sp. IAR9 TaxID=2663841 RepID=UPI0015CEDDE9|nr:LexA family transcriptional regulator [Bradyrhizobium sp. IAR9]NYG46411.1 transcriptional regulator with XRE-family HTH domain [Bradyrhizobium sp. IAR9]